MKRALILFAIAFSLVAVQTNQAITFRCFAKQKVSDERRTASAVFLGEAVAREYKEVQPTDPEGPVSGQVLTVRFRVERWWKGSGIDEVILYTTEIKRPGGLTERMAEDFEFQVGKRYIVYALGPENHLHTSECQRTAKVEQAGEDLKKLGAGRLPTSKSKRQSVIQD